MYQIALSKIFLKTVWYPNSLKKNGPPVCGIYTLGQLSKLYVLIRLEETNKIGVKRGYYFFSLIPLGDKVLSFLIQNSVAHIQEKKIIIYCNANCKTENIIYLLECAICGQYIGETKQQLSKRLNGHRSDANCKRDLPLSRHLRSTGHHDSFGKLKVTITYHNPKWDDKSRQERESFCIWKLKTLSPNRINEKK